MDKSFVEKSKSLDDILNKIPITLNLFTVIMNSLIIYGLISVPFDPDYTLHNEMSYGIYEITNTIFTLTLGVLCYRLKFCFYNWVSVFSLLLLNVNNLITIFTEIDISLVYLRAMYVGFITMTILTIVLFIVETDKRKPKL